MKVNSSILKLNKRRPMLCSWYMYLDEVVNDILVLGIVELKHLMKQEIWSNYVKGSIH